MFDERRILRNKLTKQIACWTCNLLNRTCVALAFTIYWDALCTSSFGAYHMVLLDDWIVAQGCIKLIGSSSAGPACQLSINKSAVVWCKPFVWWKFASNHTSNYRLVKLVKSLSFTSSLIVTQHIPICILVLHSCSKTKGASGMFRMNLFGRQVRKS